MSDFAVFNKIHHEIEKIGVRIDERIERLISHTIAVENAVKETVEFSEYTRKKSMVALDGTGAGTISWTVPLGFSWVLERITVTSTGNGQCILYADTTSNSDILEVIGNSLIYSDAFSNRIFVPGGSTLFAVFSGAGANGQGTVNLQIKVIRNHHSVQHQPAHFFGAA